MTDALAIAAFVMSVIGGIAAAGAAIVAACQLRESKRAVQLQVFESTFKDLRSLEERYYRDVAGKGSEIEKQWCSAFFNTLEYLAFLFNAKLIPAQPILDFYRDALINWYENIFQKKATVDQRTDPARFPELKTLYRRLVQNKKHTKN